MSQFKPIENLKPRYGFICVLRGLDLIDGTTTYCVAKWTKNGRGFYKDHSGYYGTNWATEDAWCLPETGAYTEDNFKPTHWAELPKEPDK
jgi:hypothetical protein